MKKKIIDLIGSEPHFLAAGHTYTKLASVADALKKTKAYGPLLKKLDGDAKKTGDHRRRGEVPPRRPDPGLREEAAPMRRRPSSRRTPSRPSRPTADIAASWKGDETASPPRPGSRS